jgi:hypothetical protein
MRGWEQEQGSNGFGWHRLEIGAWEARAATPPTQTAEEDPIVTLFVRARHGRLAARFVEFSIAGIRASKAQAVAEYWIRQLQNAAEASELAFGEVAT